MIDMIYLGPVPPDEDCVGIDDANYELLVREQCKRYIDVIRQKMGPEPDGARLRINWSSHDYGRYAEVVCDFDTDNESAAKYALACDWDGPQDWSDVSL